MKNLLPPDADMIIDVGYTLPDEVMYRGRPYLSAKAYSKALGEAAYSTNELGNARRSGLPHITVAKGDRMFYYYNLDDSRLWHLGKVDL